MRPLFIADDYGYAPGIDRAIVELAQHGAIDGASVLVTTADLAHVQVLHALPELRIGLHLCLTWGSPAESRERLGSLVLPSGRFGGLSRLVGLWARRGLSAAALRLEIQAQLSRLESAAGRVDFIDGHQHVHLFPPIRRALEDVLASRPGALRVRFGRARSGLLRNRIVLNTLMGLRRIERRPLPFTTTERLVDYADYAESSGCETSTEVMLHVAHPAISDASLDASSYDTAARREQFERRMAAVSEVQRGRRSR